MTESANAPLWLGPRIEHPRPKHTEAPLESGDSADSVAALQNLADLERASINAPASRRLRAIHRCPCSTPVPESATHARECRAFKAAINRPHSKRFAPVPAFRAGRAVGRPSLTAKRPAGTGHCPVDAQGQGSTHTLLKRRALVFARSLQRVPCRLLLPSSLKSWKASHPVSG